jgi:RNA polymerase sigma-54 factor
MAAQKHSLEQKQLLKQKTSLQTIQFMRMVEMPATRLEEEIKKALDENPALEIDTEPIGNEFDNNNLDSNSDISANDDEVTELNAESPISEDEMENYFHDGDADFDDRDLDYQLSTINTSKDDKTPERIATNDYSLQENLIAQLGILLLNDNERNIAEYIVGNLDDSGYLERENRAIANDLLFTYNINTSIEEIEHIIKDVIQELDPPGIGARTLQECLLIQLRRKTGTVAVRLAICIVSDFFTEFSKKHYEKLSKQLAVSEDDLKLAIDEIQKLDPRPANVQSQEELASAFINPDFFITVEGDTLNLSLNNSFIPKLKISKEFQQQYRYFNKEKNEKNRIDAEKFIKENVDNAKKFVNTLNQREITLYHTMYVIMQRQRKYFLSGNDEDLKPMVLKDIASIVNLDISTISRVSNSKYVQTFFGTIPLKHLFSESIGDEDVSSKEVKKILNDLIEKEDKSKPLTDEQLGEKLKVKGYIIARRTVAKYREQIGIAVARLRKEL